jgi:hypothetical protein
MALPKNINRSADSFVRGFFEEVGSRADMAVRAPDKSLND